MKRAFLIFLFTGFVSLVNAQPVFQKMLFGIYPSNFREPKSLHQTTKGDYIISGNMYYAMMAVGTSPLGFFYSLIDSTGNVKWLSEHGNGWRKLFRSGINKYDNFIMTGSDATVAPPNQGRFLKADTSGNLIWCKGISNSTCARSVAAVNDSNWIFAGIDCGGATQNISLVKCNTSGDTLWSFIYPVAQNPTDVLLTVTYDKGFLVCASTSSNVILIRTDSIGILLWNKVYSGLQPIYDIKITTDKGSILAGGNSIIKTDSLGTIKWGNTYSCSINSVIQYSDSTYAFAGALGSKSLLTKVNFNGSPLWTKVYSSRKLKAGSVNSINAIMRTSDKGFCMISNVRFEYGTNPLTDYGYSPMMIKTDSLGNTLNCDSTENLTPQNLLVTTSSLIINYNRGTIPTFTTSYFIAKTNGGTSTACSNFALIKETTFNDEEIFIFPNPSSGKVAISLPFNSKEIIIIDALGNEVIHLNMNADKVELDLNHLANGIYFIRISDIVQTYTKKLLINR